MKHYITSWRPREKGADWVYDQLGEDTPVTIDGAARLFQNVEAHYAKEQVRVQCLNDASGRFTDVTNEVMQHIFNDERQAAIWATEDAEHEKTESASWRFV